LREALAKIRPYMQSHGGNVDLIHLENDVARLRLEGTCKSCPSSSVTLELAVRQAVEEACPDLISFDVEGVVAQSPTTNHLPASAPVWVVMEDFGRLEEGEMREMDVLLSRLRSGLRVGSSGIKNPELQAGASLRRAARGSLPRQPGNAS
jgi:Fe-S cluster biogenesis protein NfuA